MEAGLGVHSSRRRRWRWRQRWISLGTVGRMRELAVQYLVKLEAVDLVHLPLSHNRVDRVFGQVQRTDPRAALSAAKLLDKVYLSPRHRRHGFACLRPSLHALVTIEGCVLDSRTQPVKWSPAGRSTAQEVVLVVGLHAG